MKMAKLPGRTRMIAALLGVGAIGTAVIAKNSIGSDHQQTAFTELNPRLDNTDVWAFPGSSDSRIVLATTIASPLVGTQGGRFDPNALYELKVDNNQDGRPDIVLQFLFDDMSDGTQRVSLIGPVAAPTDTTNLPGPISGMLPGGITNRIVQSAPTITRGALNESLMGTVASGQVQLFAGVRDDPFYIDLEQFFRIIPDRRPVEGPLAAFPERATAWRPDCGADGQLQPGEVGPFDPNHGCAVDFLRGFNALAIIVELPEAAVVGSGNGQIGVWATISR